MDNNSRIIDSIKKHFKKVFNPEEGFEVFIKEYENVYNITISTIIPLSIKSDPDSYKINEINFIDLKKNIEEYRIKTELLEKIERSMNGNIHLGVYKIDRQTSDIHFFVNYNIPKMAEPETSLKYIKKINGFK